MADASPRATELLRAWISGDPEALPQWKARVYRELRRMAGRFLRNEHLRHTPAKYRTGERSAPASGQSPPAESPSPVRNNA